jgi:hypothetical protein
MGNRVEGRCYRCCGATPSPATMSSKRGDVPPHNGGHMYPGGRQTGRCKAHTFLLQWSICNSKESLTSNNHISKNRNFNACKLYNWLGAKRNQEVDVVYTSTTFNQQTEIRFRLGHFYIAGSNMWVCKQHIIVYSELFCSDAWHAYYCGSPSTLQAVVIFCANVVARRCQPHSVSIQRNI